MSFKDAQAALHRAGVTFEMGEWHGGYGGGSRIAFSENDFKYSIEFDDYNRAFRIFAHRPDLPDLGIGLDMVRQLAGSRGCPAEMRVVTEALEHRESFAWQWDGRTGSLTFSLDRTGDQPWHARIICDDHPGLRGPAHLSFAEARVQADEIRARLARVVVPGGERGAAVARWTEVIGWRFTAVERFVEAVAATARDAPISIVTFGQLADHARWVEQHEQLFEHADDWRDALVVAPAGDRNDHFEPPQLGWRVKYAREGERQVRLVAGPFATGVHRVLRPADELYPLRGDLPTDLVAITVLPKEHSYKLKPDVVVASLEGVTAQLSGGRDVDLIARHLVAARARRSAGFM